MKKKTNTSIKADNSPKPYNTRHNPKKSSKALLLSLTETESAKQNFPKQEIIELEFDLMDKEDDIQTLPHSNASNISENDRNGIEVQGSDSGRSTPSKHHSDAASISPGTSGSSRPVAPLSLRRQIALALELSKDGKQLILVYLFLFNFSV